VSAACRDPSLTPGDINLHVPGVKLGIWRRACDQISILLEDLSKILFENTRTFRKQGNENGTDVSYSSCVICLAHLAILYNAVCHTDPAAGSEMYGLCDSALERLGMITSEHHLDEYTHLDLLLGVCWTFYSSKTIAETRDRNRNLGGNR